MGNPYEQFLYQLYLLIQTLFYVLVYVVFMFMFMLVGFLF